MQTLGLVGLGRVPWFGNTYYKQCQSVSHTFLWSFSLLAVTRSAKEILFKWHRLLTCSCSSTTLWCPSSVRAKPVATEASYKLESSERPLVNSLMLSSKVMTVMLAIVRAFKPLAEIKLRQPIRISPFFGPCMKPELLT